MYGRYSWAYETESYCGRKIISLAAYSNGVEVKKSHTNGAAAWQKKKKKKSVKKGTKKKTMPVRGGCVHQILPTIRPPITPRKP